MKNTSNIVPGIICTYSTFFLLTFAIFLCPAVASLPHPTALHRNVPQCTLGKDGVSKIHGFSNLTPFEQSLVDDNVPALISMAKKGSEFVKNN